MEKETLATELLKEIKNQSRRWFIAFIIMCILEVATVGGFFWYLTLPVDEYQVDIQNETGIASYVGNDMNGDIDNGTGNSN